MARDHRADAACGPCAVLQHGGDDALRQGCGACRAERRGGGRGRTGVVPRGGVACAGVRYLHNAKCVQLLAIAERMLAGEIAYRRGEYDAAFAHLRAASALEDDLPYDEPWGWMQPVRHALGALLLEQGRVAEAEAVYREDLGLGGALPRAQIHPDNVWALRGLLDCLERRGETAEAALIRQRVEIAAARADVPVAVSCFCA